MQDGSPLNVNGPYNYLMGVEIPRDFLSKVYIQRCEFNYTNTCASPEGQFTDFNVWDRPLSQEEAEEWTTCRRMNKGNLVNWETARFETENMEEDVEDLRSICTPIKPGDVVFPQRRNFASHLSLCRKMRGAPTVVQSKEMQNKLMEELKGYASCGDHTEGESRLHLGKKYIISSTEPFRFGLFDAVYEGGLWAGYWDEQDEGNFTNINTGNPLGTWPDVYSNWDTVHGEPNGDTVENCVVIQAGRRTWNDVPCGGNIEKCGACRLERSPDVQIRGLSQETRGDPHKTFVYGLVATNSYYCSLFLV